LVTCKYIMRCACLVIAVSLAQPALGASRDAETAERLFNEARALMRIGKYDQACPKLSQSQQLDPGLGTRLNLADCWEHTGQTIEAFQEFSAVALQAEALGDNERARAARARAERLESQVARLVILVPDSHRIDRLQVWRDSSLVPEEQYNRVVAVAPGPVALEANAPEHVPWRVRVDVPKGGFLRMEVPALIPHSGEPSSPASDSRPARWLQPTGIISMGAGVLGLGLGTYFGLQAPALYRRSETEGCDQQSRCTAGALRTRKRALQAGDAATVSFALGGALFGSGLALYLLGEGASDKALVLRVGLQPGAGADAALEGRF
jgi:serine/threonine-protein kinase